MNRYTYRSKPVEIEAVQFDLTEYAVQPTQVRKG